MSLEMSVTLGWVLLGTCGFPLCFWQTLELEVHARAWEASLACPGGRGGMVNLGEGIPERKGV